MSELEPYWSSEEHGLTIYHGDAAEVLADLPAGSVQTGVTSPPYWGLRDYGEDEQIGLEETPEKYVARLMEVFDRVRRVLREDATFWLNLGDSYYSSSSGQNGMNGTLDGGRPCDGGGTTTGRITRPAHNSLKPKDLVGIPWRVAFALQEAGWWLRSDIIWKKTSPMPESVTDRPTSSHEHIFLLSPSQHYYYDADAIREPHQSLDRPPGNDSRVHAPEGNTRPSLEKSFHGGGRNKRDVWTVTTKPFPEAHFAVYPPDLIRPCVKAGSAGRSCAECGAPWERVVEKSGSTYAQRKSDGIEVDYRPDTNDRKGRCGEISTHITGSRPTCDCETDETVPSTVIDPFMGAATTLLVAYQEGRRGIGIDLSEEYCEMAANRLEEEIAQGRLFEPQGIQRDPKQMRFEE